MKELKVQLVTACGCEKEMTIFVETKSSHTIQDHEIPPYIKVPLLNKMIVSFELNDTSSLTETSFRLFKLSSVFPMIPRYIYREQC